MVPVGNGMQARRRALIVPREHGAWGILLVPLATGAWVGLSAGGQAAGLPPLILATLALFWLRTPVESWIGAGNVRARTAEELRLARNAAIGLGVAASGALGWLLWPGDRWSLLWIGGAAGVAFLLQAAIKRAGRGGRAAAQVVGAAGLTSTAAAAYSVATGRLDGVAGWVWAANFLFAANQIQYVQLRIHAATVKSRGEKASAGRWFLIGQVALAMGLIGGCVTGLLRWQVAAAFVPVLARGFAWFVRAPAPLAVHLLGKSELAHAVVFGALLVAGLSWGYN